MDCPVKPGNDTGKVKLIKKMLFRGRKSQLCASLDGDHAGRRLYQREMGEGLREVSEVSPCLRVVFFRIEAEGRGDPQQPFHQVAGAWHLSHDRKRRHKPTRTIPERPLVLTYPRHR